MNRFRAQLHLLTGSECGAAQRNSPETPLITTWQRALGLIYRTHEGRTVMGKLEGKVAVITAATSGMALATARLFVKEGAYVFITGRRKDKLDEAVKLIGKNVTGVQGDASNLADPARLYDTVKREKAKTAILSPAPDRANWP